MKGRCLNAVETSFVLGIQHDGNAHCPRIPSFDARVSVAAQEPAVPGDQYSQRFLADLFDHPEQSHEESVSFRSWSNRTMVVPFRVSPEPRSSNEVLFVEDHANPWGKRQKVGHLS